MSAGPAIRVILLILLSLAVFLPTLGWGLPSRKTDRFLFGDRTPWTGQEILELLANPASGFGDPETIRGADVDADPILDRSKPVVLNDADPKRAAIVQRYRLMSGQPDEFIQFKALAEMSQRQGLSKLDPRLYQYGGLWIYPVGALIKGAMLAGLIETPPAGVNAQAFYMDHPEVFGKFYVIARAYSTAWGVIAALAVAWLATRATGRPGLGVLAAVCFILLPVTRTAAHEAKPHLAGAALCLVSVIAATKYVETRRGRWLLLAGTLCGAAMGMVVSMLLSIVVLPAAVIARSPPLPRTRGRGQGEGGNASTGEVAPAIPATPPSPQPSPPSTRERGLALLLASVMCATLVYALTNPFVLYNAIAHPEILKSNLGNSTAMYGMGGFLAAITSALRIAIDAMTLVGLSVVVFAVIALAWFGWPRRGALHAVSPTLLLTSIVSIIVLGQFILLAGEKPAEYGRFGLVPAAGACVLIAMLISLEVSRRWEYALGAIVGVTLAISLWVKMTTEERRHRGDYTALLRNQEQVRKVLGRDRVVVALAYEPAPWSSPPLDLFRTTLVLAPRAQDEFPSAETTDFYLYPANLAVRPPVIGNMQSIDWKANVFRTQRLWD